MEKQLFKQPKIIKTIMDNQNFQKEVPGNVITTKYETDKPKITPNNILDSGDVCFTNLIFNYHKTSVVR